MLSLKDIDVYIQQSYFTIEYKYMIIDTVCNDYFLKKYFILLKVNSCLLLHLTCLIV